MLCGEPFQQLEAERRIKDIARNGTVSYDQKHARRRLDERNMSMTDTGNVLLSGWVSEVLWERNSYRYTIETPKMAVVVAFRSETEILVVTAWRIGS